jgi:hypothetical protein
VASEVPPNRREEILEYLRLFGYKPETTILQVHISSFFHRKVRGHGDLRQAAKRAALNKRYGGTTFVIVGRSHDPSIMHVVLKPRKESQANPGYVGYLWRGRNRDYKAPHEILPLDFTPSALHYPNEWKLRFGATKGFMIAMHVPASFAPKKNALIRAISKAGKTADVKSNWTFLSAVKQFGQEEQRQTANWTESLA